jgi:hypothetical protein
MLTPPDAEIPAEEPDDAEDVVERSDGTPS